MIEKANVRVILGLVLLTCSSLALAAVPGGETISNTVTVSYQDSSATTNYSETAQVDVTIVETFAVAFVNASNFGSAPDSTVDPGDDVTAISTAPSVWVVNAGNTSVNVDVDLADTSDPLTGTVGNDFRYTRFGNGAGTTADGTTPLNTNLGLAIVSVADASLADAGGGVSEPITFYSATTDLAVNDLVTIGGGTTIYEVHSIPTATTLTLRDYGSTAASPTFTGGIAVSQYAAIAEAVFVELTGTFGTFTDDTTPSGSTYTTTKTQADSSFQGTLSVTSTNNSPTLPSDLVYDATIKGPSITISKYVRNINGAVCSTNTYTSGTNTYCSTVDDAETGDQLEYLLVVENANTAASGDADLNLETVVLTDVAPTSYTSFDTASETGAVSPIATSGANCDITTSPIWDVANANADSSGLETWADDSARTNKGQVSESAGTITAYLGTGATNAAGGSLAPNESQCFSFTVTVL